LLLAAGEHPDVRRTGTCGDRLRRAAGHWYLSERIAQSDGGPLTGPAAADR
jgi:hypothetical protein